MERLLNSPSSMKHTLVRLLYILMEHMRTHHRPLWDDSRGYVPWWELWVYYGVKISMKEQERENTHPCGRYYLHGYF